MFMIFCQIPGKGNLRIIDQTASGVGIIAGGDWSDVLYDATWSENNANILVTACGDGSVLVWDTNRLQVISLIIYH